MYQILNKEKIKIKEEKRIKSGARRKVQKVWREKNREKYLEKRRSHYQRNKEKIKAMNKSYYIRNKVKLDASRKIWREKNKERIYEHCLKRASRLDVKRGSFAKVLKDNAVRFGLNLCEKCRGYINTKKRSSYHIDHIVPLSSDGNNDIDNLQLLCQRCNLEKGRKEEKYKFLAYIEA